MSYHLEKIRSADQVCRGRLIFAPYAAGSSFSFYAIAARMPDGVDCYGYDYPGRVARPGEPLESNIAALGAELSDLIAQDPATPTLLFGHSMGSFVAFHAARRLSDRSQAKLQGLILSSQRGPQMPSRPPFVHEMNDEEIIQELQRTGGAPASVLSDPEAMDFLRPILRSDAGACAAYIADIEKVIEAPVVLYHGDEEYEDLTQEELLAWGEFTQKRPIVRTFIGGHFYFNTSWDHFISSLRSDVSKMLDLHGQA